MADIVDLHRAPFVDGKTQEFDALAMRMKEQAGMIADLALAAKISTEAVRAELFARQVLHVFDVHLAPLAEQMRARLGRPNPFAEGR